MREIPYEVLKQARSSFSNSELADPADADDGHLLQQASRTVRGASRIYGRKHGELVQCWDKQSSKTCNYARKEVLGLQSKQPASKLFGSEQQPSSQQESLKAKDVCNYKANPKAEDVCNYKAEQQSRGI
ncbi:hypothetical protein SELMODRAFT_406344 [Selaginella moellendorffii]|uniref:Uncharacterized protein n=1 Tax=Selaginella moellendorffii TaxID=88036 RepID=D8R228_SELML|nr:hypothetical protein SELMODRAFT_406344 [Selaginella moellendorffii]